MLQWLHICPIVKRIWTSSYTLYSGGLVLLILAGVLRADRVEGLAALVVPAAGDRRQLDRDLRHELDDRAVRLVGAGAASRAGAVRDPGPAVRAGPARRGGAGGVLVDPVLDVSVERSFCGSETDGMGSDRVLPGSTGFYWVSGPSFEDLFERRPRLPAKELSFDHELAIRVYRPGLPPDVLL